ncbi:MAG: DPP IV N-terminal domain-containing protein [Cyclobacteriaceae bacterium]
MKQSNQIRLILLGITLSIISSFPSQGQSTRVNKDFKIYFTLRENEDENARVVSYDGKELVDFKVQNGKSSRGENKPSVSSDGKWIVFNTYQFGGWKAAISSIDGSAIRQVSKSSNYSGFPSFSQDNQWIVFYEHENGRMGNRDIYKIRVDGTEKTRLTQNSKHHYYPAFSPDGSKIAFVSAREGGNYEVFVMNSDGSEPKNITKNVSHESCPSWSPDGKRLAFLSIRDGYLNLYTMNPDGSGLKNVTNNQKRESNQFIQTAQSVDELSYMYGTSWSPDGKQIVFVQKMGELQKLFIVDTDGKNLRELVETKGEQTNPNWAK